MLARHVRPTPRSGRHAVSSSVRVSVIIVAYQSGDWLQRSVDALAGQTMRDFEALIADNASTDGSVDRLRLPDERFQVLPMGGNLGFAAGNNRAAERAAGEFIACLNPDAQPAADWLEQLLRAADRHPEAAAFGSTQLRYEDERILDGVGDVWHAAGLAWRAREGRPATNLPPEGEVFSPCGAAALYRAADFRAVGGFDERFFCYCEDVDIGFRLRLAGRACIQAPAAVVLHEGSAISGRRSEFTVYHGHRNRIWTFVKNTPGPLLWVLAPYHLAVNAWLLTVFLRIGMAPVLLRAYRDALRGLPAVWRDRRRTQRSRRASLQDVARAFEWSLLAVRRRDVHHFSTRSAPEIR